MEAAHTEVHNILFDNDVMICRRAKFLAQSCIALDPKA